ncbi:N-substituted formamide deformylase precursor [Virgibacillus salexigens]|uniref:N-substituted formamide deformylase n=2 Tax=Virgibacillus TaxID=84406 RepID=A0A024Q7U7_9BACI|nr:N-substituted formamide deformylase precursor [Virgibacillus massiliensis]
MENEKDVVEAVLVEDGVIKKVGSFIDFESFMNDSRIEKIDLKGKTLMPGFIDPHGHLAMMGPISQMADLSKCESFDDVIYTLKLYIENRGLNREDVVVGFGYDHNFLKEEKHPTKEVLNHVSAENPIFVFHASGHVGCTNDAGLKLAEIDENTPNEDGGVIGRIEGTMEPNGYLEEGSLLSLQKTLFQDSKADIVELANLGQAMYIKNGITTVQDGATSSEYLELFKALAEQGDLKVDVVAYPLVVENPDDMGKNEKYAKKYHRRLKIGGYKLFLDGSPQGKTAWMTEPYEGEETYRGYSWYKDEQVKQYVAKAINDDVQLLTHSNGDAASDQLLRNYEAALQESDNSNKANLRPVMIHCQTVRNDQLDKMVELSMIPSIFIPHTYYWGDVHLKNLGHERGSRISPAKSAFERGLVVNFHQDPPVVKPDMLETIWCAVNRITRKGVHIGPEECIPVYDAIKAVTINAAYAYFEEDQKGSIKEGKLADLVILDQNPLKVDKMKIKELQVVETIKEGKTIYSVDSVLTE